MDFSKINAVGDFEELPMIKLHSLPKDRLFTITAAKQVDTKYGKSVVLEISTEAVYVNTRLAVYFKANPKQFKHFQKHVENGSPKLEYIGGKYNSIRIHPDLTLITEDQGAKANFYKINAVANFEERPLVKLSSLRVDYRYTITEARKVDTKYGVAIIVVLDDEQSVFLNRRMAKFFEENPSQLENLQHEIATGSPQLQYLGGQHNRLLIHSNKELNLLE